MQTLLTAISIFRAICRWSLFVKHQEAVNLGIVNDCLEFMTKASQKFSFKILMMGYLNTAWKMGYSLPMHSRQRESGFILQIYQWECEEIHRIAEKKGLA